jgi:purine-binding chemotaxis protein CheW
MTNDAVATQTASTTGTPAPGGDGSRGRSGGKYLTFFLGREEYGLAILKVHEIMGIMPITPVPRTPEFIRGVINLRGKVIPIVDLRIKFGMEQVEQTEETCIIVVQSPGGQTGIVVDKVSEVLDIAASDIEDTPSFGVDVNTDYILGVGKSEGRVKLLAGDVVDLGLAAMEGGALGPDAAASPATDATESGEGERRMAA